VKVTYIHHSGFLVESDRFYYLFDYEQGKLPPMDTEKPIFVLSSHSHADHYTPKVFSLLADAGMQSVQAVLSEDITPPEHISALSVAPGQTYALAQQVQLTTFHSTDLGVAFLLQDGDALVYHAGDLNDWVWDGESDAYNREMTQNYRHQIRLLAQTLAGRRLDVAFVVLDPRQEAAYDRGLCYFLETVAAKQDYPMHYWQDPSVMETFLQHHPCYRHQIQNTQSQAHCAETR
jgi:hypothetical protein